MISIIKKQFKPILATALMLLAYMPTLLWMWERWMSKNSYYGHGILVPVASIVLIALDWDEVKKLKPKESGWGLPLIGSGLAIHFLSSVFRINFTSGFSMLITLSGIVLYFYGTKIFRKILFPLFFLVFMIPLPEYVIINLTFQMKIFSAKAATYVLNNIRIRAIQEGSYIIMPTSYVIVDDVCSGLRSMIALIALGSIFAFWLKRPFFLKVLMFLLAIPIAVIGNMCRVVFLAFISEVYGTQYLETWIHDASGFIIYFVAFVLLASCWGLLNEKD